MSNFVRIAWAVSITLAILWALGSMAYSVWHDDIAHATYYGVLALVGSKAFPNLAGDLDD